MKATLNQIAAESLSESFEAMAFLAAMPAEQPYEQPAESLLLSLRFTGTACGVVEMVAPRSLGRLAACNMLCVDPGTPAHYDDTLKELLNVCGGQMLRRWNTRSQKTIEIALPQLQLFDPASWQGFIESPGASVLDIEGNVMALRVRMCD